MVLISATIIEWPQSLNMVTTGTRAMEIPTQQVPLESPKCPRCDSSNTKFCYYNNYSLAQPRHFCKACKRYWTRGGTLRNVPVGGGFRKNKKVKHSISVVDLPPSKPSPVSTSSNPNMIFNGLSASPNPNPNPVLTPGVSNVEAVLGFDPQPQMSGFGLGFSNPNGNYQDGSTNSHLSSYSLLGSSINTPTIASFLGENLNQQKYISNINGGFQGLSSLGEVKIEEIRQKYQSPNIQNHLEQIHPSDSTLPWNGAWFDTTNIGSISSLI